MRITAQPRRGRRRYTPLVLPPVATSGEAALWREVFWQALRDLSECDAKVRPQDRARRRDEAAAWIYRDDPFLREGMPTLTFAEVAVLVGVDTEAVRERLAAGVRLGPRTHTTGATIKGAPQRGRDVQLTADEGAAAVRKVG